MPLPRVATLGPAETLDFVVSKKPRVQKKRKLHDRDVSFLAIVRTLTTDNLDEVGEKTPFGSPKRSDLREFGQNKESRTNMRVMGQVKNNPPRKSLSSFKFRFTRKTRWVKFSPFGLGCGLKKTDPELAMRKVNQAGGRVIVGTMDRRTFGFSIAISSTRPESLRWFALDFSAALNITTRVSISTAPRLNQSDPGAVAPAGLIFADSRGGNINGVVQVDRTLARAIPWFETCSSGRWAVVALDHSHVAGSQPAAVSPRLLGTPADALEKARGRQIVAK